MNLCTQGTVKWGYFASWGNFALYEVNFRVYSSTTKTTRYTRLRYSILLGIPLACLPTNFHFLILPMSDLVCRWKITCFFVKIGEFKLLYFYHIAIFSIVFNFGHKYVENSQDLEDLMTIAKYRLESFSFENAKLPRWVAKVSWRGKVTPSKYM